MGLLLGGRMALLQRIVRLRSITATEEEILFQV